MALGQVGPAPPQALRLGAPTPLHEPPPRTEPPVLSRRRAVCAPDCRVQTRGPCSCAAVMRLSGSSP